jgi:UDP-GlcNAc:undecaprenyl-phosphate GlcNAc-1-phosphate transferase
MNSERIALFLASILVAACVTPLVRAWARKRGVVDAPDGGRKLHSGPTPLWGGLALWLALVVVGIPAWRAGLLTDVKIGNGQLLGILIASLLLVVGGMWDDAKGLKPWRQFLFPAAAVLMSLAAGIGVQYITNPFIAGTGPYGRALLYISPWVGSAITGVWLLGMTYTTKLLDGLDGLVTGVGAIGALILFMVSLYWDAPLSGTSFLALIVTGVCLGFLMYNMHPASVFLGEGGSTLIGFLLGVLAIISGAKIAAALLIMGIPILDVAWIIVRRLFFERRSVAAADRKHLHFRLLDAGLTQRQAVLVLWCMTAVFGTSSIFLQSQQKVMALAVLVLVMVALALILVVRHKRTTFSRPHHE